MSKWSPKSTARCALVAGLAGAMALGMPALAQGADAESEEDAEVIDTTLPETLAGGVLVNTGSGAPVLHELNVNGIYYLGDKPSGGWVYKNGRLCLVTIPGDVTCTEVPDNLSAGDSWTSADASGAGTEFALPGGGNTSDGEEDDG